MKPILVASAVALAAPALAQTTTTAQPTPPPTTSETMPGQAPTTPMQKPPVGQTMPTTTPGQTMPPAEEQMRMPAMPHEGQMPTTTTTTGTTPSTMPPGTTTGTMTPPSGAAATTGTPAGAEPSTTGAGMAGTSPERSGMMGAAPGSQMPTLARWDFRGDMGKIGTRDWGVGQHMASTGGMGTGGAAMGGPIDVDSQWSTMSPTGAALTPLQFGVWMLEAYGQDVDKPVMASLHSRRSNLPAVQVLNVTAGALAEADTNHDWHVSREELAAFAGS